METETLFSSTRWEILSTLSQKKLSPMELALSIKTTSANISQQLRLLELAGLVKSEKISNTDKGKPRVIYSLAGPSSFVVFLGRNFAQKKMLMPTEYHKFVMRSLFLDNSEHHALVNEFYFRVKESLKDIEVIAAESGSSLTIYLVAKKQLKFDDKTKVKQLELEELKKKKVLVLYDPEEKTGG